MKLILFDDHELFAKSIAFSLADEFESFITYGVDVNFLDVVKKEKPDIVLMDINLGKKNGIDEGEILLEMLPELKLIFLSGHNYPEYHSSAIKMGAKAFINKSASIDELVNKVKMVEQGNTIFPSYKKIAEELSVREKEILQLAAEGHSQQEIADRTFISKRTVTTHIQTINGKLGVNSTISAIVRGIELGIVRIKL